jgi:hypothetical protein
VSEFIVQANGTNTWTIISACLKYTRGIAFHKWVRESFQRQVLMRSIWMQISIELKKVNSIWMLPVLTERKMSKSWRCLRWKGEVHEGRGAEYEGQSLENWFNGGWLYSEPLGKLWHGVRDVALLDSTWSRPWVQFQPLHLPPKRTSPNYAGMVAHACNPISQEAKARETRVQGCPGLHSESISKQTKRPKMLKSCKAW